MAIVDTAKIDPSVVVKLRNSAGGNSLEYIDAGILYNNDIAPVTTINNLIDDCIALETAITNNLAAAVLLTTNQSVGGVKTFTDGIAFSSTKGINDALLVIGAGLAAGDRSFRASRHATGTPYAALLWIESSTLWKVTTDGSALAKLQGAAPTVGDDYVTKTYADGLVIAAMGVIQQASTQTANNALTVNITDTLNPLFFRGDGTQGRPVTGIQQGTAEPAVIADGNIWLDKTDVKNPLLKRRDTASSKSHPISGIYQATSAPAVIDTGTFWLDKTNTGRPELKWYNGTTSKDVEAGVKTDKKVTLTDGATPALDASLGNFFVLSAAGDRTIAVPSNASVGQKIIIKHIASGGARTLSLNTGANGFRFGSEITALTQTVSGKSDYIGCMWNDADSKWDVIGYVKGY